MPKKKIVLVFEFEETVYTDENCTDLSLSKIKLGKNTTLSSKERDQVTEVWGQSDRWHVDVHNDILEIISSGDSVRYS